MTAPSVKAVLVLRPEGMEWLFEVDGMLNTRVQAREALEALGYTSWEARRLIDMAFRRALRAPQGGEPAHA